MAADAKMVWVHLWRGASVSLEPVGRPGKVGTGFFHANEQTVQQN